jgi:hypothetical protein
MTMNVLLVLRERRAIEEQRLVSRPSSSLWLERYEDYELYHHNLLYRTLIHNKI